MIRIGLVGAGGRMGQAIQSCVLEDSKNFKISWLASGRRDSEFASTSIDVVIDFSSPQASLRVANFCAQNKIPCLIGTTGISEAHQKKIHKVLSKRCAYALVPNTSEALHLLCEALELMAPKLGPNFDISIVESHHRLKKDAPSGTAKLLAEAISSAIHPRNKIQIHSIRAGTEPGEHRVLINGAFEKLELTHHAQDRKLFALGALKIARSLVKKNRGKFIGLLKRPEYFSFA